MAYTTPFTAVVGAVIQSSDWNTSGRDNISWLKSMLAGTVSELVSPAAWGDRPKGYNPVVLGTGDTAVYTCPANTVAVVTEVRVTAWQPGITVTLKAKGKTIANAEPVGRYDTAVIPCFIVLTAGQTILGSASAGTSASASVNAVEVPSSYSGFGLLHAVGATISASTWTAILTPTAGKNWVARFVMLQGGATAPTRLVLGWNSVSVMEIIPAISANGCWRWNGELFLPAGSTLQVYSDQQLANYLVCGWEEA